MSAPALCLDCDHVHGGRDACAGGGAVKAAPELFPAVKPSDALAVVAVGPQRWHIGSKLIVQIVGVRIIVKGGNHPLHEDEARCLSTALKLAVLTLENSKLEQRR